MTSGGVQRDVECDIVRLQVRFVYANKYLRKFIYNFDIVWLNLCTQINILVILLSYVFNIVFV